mmetsp:Transcript_26135/g.73109  ORF Transcript_26135/g.73109 Transcript_26135/m.73109 type:complete len:233 (-) Transcript_26135:832-1530(-)
MEALAGRRPLGGICRAEGSMPLLALLDRPPARHAGGPVEREAASVGPDGVLRHCSRRYLGGIGRRVHRLQRQGGGRLLWYLHLHVLVTRTPLDPAPPQLGCWRRDKRRVLFHGKAQVPVREHSSMAGGLQLRDDARWYVLPHYGRAVRCPVLEACCQNGVEAFAVDVHRGRPERQLRPDVVLHVLGGENASDADHRARRQPAGMGPGRRVLVCGGVHRPDRVLPCYAHVERE